MEYNIETNNTTAIIAIMQQI